MMTHCRDNDGCGHEDGVDDDILPEDEVNVNHDELVNKGEGKVKQGRNVEQVVAVPGMEIIKLCKSFQRSCPMSIV